MFVVLVTYKKSLQLVDQHLDAHREFLALGYKKNYFIMSGRKNPRTGGVILSPLSDRKVLEDFIRQDPFYAHEIAGYEVIEFTPTSYHHAFAGLIEHQSGVGFDFLVVLMTRNLPNQIKFYQAILELQIIFDNQDTIGLGKNGRLFIVLRLDQSENSHHLSEQKGPQILTFKCAGDSGEFIEKLKRLGYELRNIVNLPDQSTQYLFIEDYDGNEICLDFPLARDLS